MKNDKKVKFTALASGAAVLAAFGVNSANAADLFNYESLGTGAELRSNLITADALNAFTSNTDVEFECGEGKCGEGKCGEDGAKKDDKAKKSDSKSEAKPAAKSAEAAPAGDSKAKKAEASPAKSEKAAKPAKSEKATDAPKN